MSEARERQFPQCAGADFAGTLPANATQSRCCYLERAATADVDTRRSKMRDLRGLMGNRPPRNRRMLKRSGFSQMPVEARQGAQMPAQSWLTLTVNYIVVMCWIL